MNVDAPTGAAGIVAAGVTGTGVTGATAAGTGVVGSDAALRQILHGLPGVDQAAGACQGMGRSMRRKPSRPLPDGAGRSPVTVNPRRS